MFNLAYRYAVRNRSRNFRKFGRAAWVKRAAMSRTRKFETSHDIVVRDNNSISSVLGKRTREVYPFVTKKRLRWEDRAEDWLKQHPSTVKFVSGIVDKIWDNGGRYVARGVLKRTRRGQLRGYEEL